MIARLVATVAMLAAATAAQVAEVRPLMLRHLTAADGLPQSTVMATLRDSQGFVWLATEGGLVRHDGRQLTVYGSSGGEGQSLPGSFVWQVAEGADGDLWIALKGAGLARWRRATDRFEVHRHDPARADSLASDAVRTVLVDSDGQVWVGTSDAGISILDPATGSFRHLRSGTGSAGALSSDEVFSLAMDRRGDILIGTAGGLDRWLAGEQRLLRIPAVRSQVSHVIEDPDQTLWVATFDAGLMHVDAQGRLLDHFRHLRARPDSLANDDVRAVLRDRTGNLWVGTSGGLDLLDGAGGGFVHYGNDQGDAASLRDSSIMSLYQDSTGLVWIGTRSGGVSRWNPRSWEMGGSRPGWLQGQEVIAFADAQGSDIWIGSMAGLHRLDTRTGVATGIDAIANRKDALGGEPVMSLRESGDGSLWIGTMGAGLKRLHPGGRLESLAVAPGNPRALSAPGIMSIAEARDGRIWVGTFGGGANIVDPRTGVVEQLLHGSGIAGAVSAGNVTAILPDASGRVWLGTERGGINLADPDGTVLRVFRHDPDAPGGLPSNNIYSLALDAMGHVWAGTDAGVARLQDPAAAPQAMQFRAVQMARERGSAVAYGVVADRQDGIWISGNAGLTRFDPATGATRVFHREDGLQGEEFMFGAYHRLRDGRLAFGGLGGFNIFDPQDVFERRAPPQPVLTQVDVLGEPAGGELAYWMRRSLDFGYRANIISFDFAITDHAAPEHARLAYRVPGLIDGWEDLGADRHITLTNLAAGEHVLEVRAASADSDWSAPQAFTIRRDPAPWRTAWAYGLYMLLAAALVAARIRHQRNKFLQMQRTQAHLESQVALRTSELVDSNRQLEEAARAKSDFLDRMSHELRTPMNGVVGMTELLSRTSLSATQTHLTKTIKASAQILLQIVNDLLDLSKIRAGKVALERLPVDIGQVLEECTSLFAGAAESKGIELIVCPPAESHRQLLGDPLRVRQVLMNLVGNAVKFTSQGEIVVRADIEARDAGEAIVHLAVSDTGIGMEPAVLARIFDPFTQADEKTTRQFGGTGLGLAICRELAELMGGSITVESRQQVGSTFCVHLPVTIGETLPATVPVAATVQLQTRRPALAEALQRHCVALGVQLATDASEPLPVGGQVRIVDASTQEPELARLLAGSEADRNALVVIATPVEAERLGLRVLLPERAVVLKPVHRVALREALETVTGVAGPRSAMAPGDWLGRLKGHVLLVEDDPVNAAVAEGYLAELGCTATWVTSAMAAVARIQSEHFDLVLMDLNMPDMDGFAATRRIREHEAGRSHVPVIALTAHDARTYRERVLQAGMDDILSKPYTLHDCHATLARWMSACEPDAAPAQRVHESLASVDGHAVSALEGLGSGRRGPLFKRLVGLYEGSSRALLGKLEAALAGGDLAAAAGVCHTLKSSSANVGALAFAARVRELEQLCREGQAQRAAIVHRQLSAAHEPLLAALQEFSMAATA